MRFEDKNDKDKHSYVMAKGNRFFLFLIRVFV
jgi:hypothetical protein